MNELRVAWLAPYAVPLLEPAIQLARWPTHFHPASWLVHLAKALAEQPDMDLHVVTLSQYVAHSQTVRVDNITFHVLRSAVPFTNRGYPGWLPLDLLTGFASEVRSLCNAVTAIQPDLVHAHGTEAAYAPAAVRTGLPCLISIQGVVAEYYKSKPNFRLGIVRHFERYAVRRAHYLTCRTAFDSGFVRMIHPAATIFPINEAMSPVYFEGQWEVSPVPRLLFVGALEERKGLHVLLEALVRVKQAVPAVTLRVVGGTGADGIAMWIARCTELGLADSVEFVGFQTAEQIAWHHRDCQVFVLPSRIENSPNTLAEAMVSGMPVIATRVGGVPSMIEDGVSGQLVSWNEPADLAEQIVELLTNTEERKRLGENARRIARERHDPANVAAVTRQAYIQILREEATHDKLN